MQKRDDNDVNFIHGTMKNWLENLHIEKLFMHLPAYKQEEQNFTILRFYLNNGYIMRTYVMLFVFLK